MATGNFSPSRKSCYLDDKENITPENMKTVLRMKGNPVSSPFSRASGNKNKAFKILTDEEIGNTKLKGKVEPLKGSTKRKSLATLQPSTLGKGSLTGQYRDESCLKQSYSKLGSNTKKNRSVGNEKKDNSVTTVSTTSEKAGKFDQGKSVKEASDCDELVKDAILLMTQTEKVDDSYWKSLAEERRVALEETLVENDKLCDEIEKLEGENSSLKKKLNEAECFKVLYNNLLEEIETMKKEKDNLNER